MSGKLAVLGAILVLGWVSDPVLSVPIIPTLSDSKALIQSTEIVLVPGRSSVIEFRNGEMIQFISLADIHQIVFSTDLPIDTGQASIIVLKPIEPLRLKGLVEIPYTGLVRENYPAKTIYPTNLVVVTSSKSGEKRTYTFDISISLTRNPEIPNGIAIVPQVQPSTEETLTLTDGRKANLSDIQRGYTEALKQKYTSYKDPAVKKIQKFLDLARYGVSFSEAAQRADLPFVVIESLAEIGLQDIPKENLNNKPSLLRGLVRPIPSRSRF